MRSNSDQGRGDGGRYRLALALSEIVGAREVIADRERLVRFESGYTRRVARQGPAGGDSRIGGRRASVLGGYRDAGVGIVVHGGNTGLVGGRVPEDEVVLLTRRLNGLAEVDPLRRASDCGRRRDPGGGTAARSGGWFRPTDDLAARSAATIGG